MNIRTVKLIGGPCDGALTMASHDTAWHNGELYAHAGDSNSDTFGHVKSVLSALPHHQHDAEKARVSAWMRRGGTEFVPGIPIPIPPPLSDLIGIPPWRINMWIQLLKTL